MSEQFQMWFTILHLMWLPFYVIAFVYIRRQPDDGSQAKWVATTAVVIMAGNFLVGAAIRGVVARYLSPSGFAGFELFFHIASNFVSMLAIGMVFVAVFTGRDAKSLTQPAPMSSLRVGSSQPDNNNPYLPPSN